jgi:hypothetical protein
VEGDHEIEGRGRYSLGWTVEEDRRLEMGILLDQWEDKIVVIGVDVGVLDRGVVVEVEDEVVARLYWSEGGVLVVFVVGIVVRVVAVTVEVVVMLGDCVEQQKVHWERLVRRTIVYQSPLE